MDDFTIRLYQTPVQSLPEDLYIPPAAFAIWLEQFEGPLDFLLYLVKKNNFDITRTALLPITAQYLDYIKQLDDAYFELAGDYLLMASTLIAIKSELLLPAPAPVQDEVSPTKTLLDRLAHYAQIKHASERLDSLLRLERDVFLAYASLPDSDSLAQAAADLRQPYPADWLAASLRAMQTRLDYQMHTHHIRADRVRLAERMRSIRQFLRSQQRALFCEVLDKRQGRLGVVVSFVAVLELAKQRVIDFSIDENSRTNIDQLTLVWAA